MKLGGNNAGFLSLTGIHLVLIDDHASSGNKQGNFCKAQPNAQTRQQPENNPETKEQAGRDEFEENLIFLLMNIFFDGFFSKNWAVCLIHMPHRCPSQKQKVCLDEMWAEKTPWDFLEPHAMTSSLRITPATPCTCSKSNIFSLLSSTFSWYRRCPPEIKYF